MASLIGKKDTTKLKQRRDIDTHRQKDKKPQYIEKSIKVIVQINSSVHKNNQRTRSIQIQRTKTPPRLRPLTLSKVRPRKFTSLDVS